MTRKERLAAASLELSDEMQETCIRNFDENDGFLIEVAKQYGLKPKELANYHNVHGYTADDFAKDWCADMGVPYNAIFHD